MFLPSNLCQLQSIEIHDICCHIASSVVSGGVRRSAMIAMFDRDDELMLKCKTGNWWEENPQRAFANNSVLASQDENISYEEIKKTLSVVRQFGEPGFINVPSYDYVVNPCGEIVMKPTIDIRENGKLVRETGFAFCNLVEINNKAIENKEMFYEACESASFIATVQSLYIDFKYLGRASKLIAKRDRAIGVSITGFYENNNLNKDVLEVGAKLVTIKNGCEIIETGLKKLGSIIGDYVEVGCNSVLNPGTVIGRNSNIYPLSCVRGFVAENSILKSNGVLVNKV